MSGDVGGPVGKEGRPRQAGWGWGALTIEAHVMVGEDGRAVPFGRAPDHHVQQAIRCLNVMFLERKQHRGSPYSWLILLPPLPLALGSPPGE